VTLCSLFLLLVIAFAGDALICVFQTALDAATASPEDMAKDYCSRAVHCAFALRDHSEHGLTAHIGVSCGDMSFANLGGHRNSWIYLLNGACIPELSDCIDNAGSKEVVCTKVVHDAILSKLGDSESIVANTCTEDGYNFKVESLDTVQLAPPAHSRFYEGGNSPSVTSTSAHFVPRPASEAINSGTFHLLSELREVTTLFLKLDSYDPVANRDPLTLQAYFYMCQQALSKTGGFLRQFLVDDKGCVVIAMWGVPSFTYPHNGSIAVNCGMAIHAGTLALGHRCSIGITTGNVFCGNVGSLVRRDFVGIGHTVNLAARLMCKAKGLIYIDEATFSYLPQDFRLQLRATEPFQVKGIDHPIIAYICDNNLNLNFIEIQKIGDHKKSYLAKRTAALLVSHLDQVKTLTKQNRVATMLNNAATLDDLQSIMTASAPDKSHVYAVVIEGVSGSGKTAAAAYYKVHARRNNMRMVHIVAKPADENVKYGTVRKLFMQLLGPRAANADEQTQKSVLKRLIRDVPWTNWTGSVSPVATVVSSAADAALPGHADREADMDQKTRAKFIVASACTSDDKIYALAFGLGLMSLIEFMYPTDTDTADEHPNPEDSAVKANVTDDVVDVMIVVALQSLISKTVQVVLVEDVHYLDKASWGAIRQIMEMPIAVSICLTSRHLHSGGGTVTTPLSGMGEGFLGAVKKFFIGGSSDTGKINQNQVSPANVARNTKKHGVVLELYEAITNHPRATYIKMTPLTFKEIKKLMEQQLKGITSTINNNNSADPANPCKNSAPVVLNDKVIQVILEISSGNIFWIKEIATFIIEHGVEEFNNKINVKENENANNPLQVLVICRLEKLSTEEQVTLRHAAVIGEEFSLHLLVSIMPFKLIKQIDNIMGALLNSSFIELSETDNENYVFSNSVIHHIISELMPPG